MLDPEDAVIHMSLRFLPSCTVDRGEALREAHSLGLYPTLGHGRPLEATRERLQPAASGDLSTSRLL